jgi:hypothetical protein
MSIARMRNGVVLLPYLFSCAGAARPPEAPVSEAAAASPSKITSARAREAPLDPEQALGLTDAIRRDQAGLDADRFETHRQVVELRKAVALYRQFIDRAAGDPRYVEAVRRTEGRIEDAEKTIDFLLGGAGE